MNHEPLQGSRTVFSRAVRLFWKPLCHHPMLVGVHAASPRAQGKGILSRSL